MCARLPPQPPPIAIRRTASGALDLDHYRRRVRVERAAFLRAILACLARHGRRAWRCIRAKLEGRSTREALAALSARELKDLGVSPSDFDAIVTGTYFTDPTRGTRTGANP